MVGWFCFLSRGCGCESCLFLLSLPTYPMSHLASPVHKQNSLFLSLSCAHYCQQAAQQCLLQHQKKKKVLGAVSRTVAEDVFLFVMLSGKSEYCPNREQWLYRCYIPQSKAIRAFINPFEIPLVISCINTTFYILHHKLNI